MTLREYFEEYYRILSQDDLEKLDVFFCTDSPLLQSTKQQFSAMRQQYELTLTLLEVSVLSKQDDVLIVRDGLKFCIESNDKKNEYTSTNIHTFVNEDNSWKIHNSAGLPRRG
ncbi:hypothetical protein ACSLBF_17260 [Pseudoalteromonas sp. T1lg65]|uniref:hypothetical protein n=1 Tax=Pseudoalteromonas sp. T1lg65 TaxID=2077101 RepID=UPI003F79E2AE